MAKNKRPGNSIILAVCVLALGILFLVFKDFVLDVLAQLNLSALKENYESLTLFSSEHPIKAALSYFVLYIAITALSLPGAAIMTVAAGAVFGLFWGTVLVSFASTIGATIAFLLTRYFFRNLVRKKFGDKLKALNEGIQRDGAFYLLTLRLVPVIPFFAVNAAMALTPIRTGTFYLVSQIGMLLGTIIFVNAGTQLAALDTLSGVLSTPILMSLCLLGIFPLITKKIADTLRGRRVYAGWKKPKEFDYNLIVIGGGAAGLVSSYIASAVRAKVALIEKENMGGDCLNTGCVPSKAIIKSAKFIHQARHSGKLGIQEAKITFDFQEILRRVRRVIKKIEPHDSIERYTSLGVDCFAGNAKMVTPWTVEVSTSTEKRILSARNIIIASGASPIVPPLPGLKDVQYVTSNTIWDIQDLPKKLLVIGGGAIGCELAQAFCRIGSEVVLLEAMERILIKEDPEVSEIVANHMSDDGIALLSRHRAKGFLVENGLQLLVCEGPNGEIRIEFDLVLFAIGRGANLRGFGLEDINAIEPDDRVLRTNEYLETRYPNIFACGDVTGLMQFTHAAAHQAWYAAVNSLFGTFKRFRINFDAIPWATFTSPEVARVGLNETEARERGIDFDVTCYEIDDLDRAIVDSEDYGFIKVLTKPKSDKILGVTIVGENASEYISEFVLALKQNIGLNKILATTHIYPTFSETNKYVAGEWKRANTSAVTLGILERFHKLRR